jgi:hypothetical protein
MEPHLEFMTDGLQYHHLSARLTDVHRVHRASAAGCRNPNDPKRARTVVAGGGATVRRMDKAEVFDVDGRPLRQGTLLDGIQHVLATASGHIWVGYFDEGVYGDNPVAHHGIVRFTPGLDPDWTYPFDTDAGPVDDCYALNVDGEAAWAYYYSSFPIVRITDGSVTAWRTEVAGAAGLLAAAGACALVGGYGVADSDRLVVGQLAHRRYEIIDELRLTLPGGQPMPTASFICRGPDLHVFIGRSWYRLALDDIV